MSYQDAQTTTAKLGFRLDGAKRARKTSLYRRLRGRTTEDWDGNKLAGTVKTAEQVKERLQQLLVSNYEGKTNKKSSSWMGPLAIMKRIRSLVKRRVADEDQLGKVKVRKEENAGGNEQGRVDSLLCPRLRAIREAVRNSTKHGFLRNREVTIVVITYPNRCTELEFVQIIGGSIIIVRDDRKMDAYLLDFGKATLVDTGPEITHEGTWVREMLIPHAVWWIPSNKLRCQQAMPASRTTT